MLNHASSESFRDATVEIDRVVATDGTPVSSEATAGGAREFVRTEEDGFLVPPDHAGAIADAVGSVLDDRDRLREMGIAGRETHEAHHSWIETGRRVRGYLRWVVEADGDEP